MNLKSLAFLFYFNIVVVVFVFFACFFYFKIFILILLLFLFYDCYYFLSLLITIVHLLFVLVFNCVVLEILNKGIKKRLFSLCRFWKRLATRGQQITYFALTPNELQYSHLYSRGRKSATSNVEFPQKKKKKVPLWNVVMSGTQRWFQEKRLVLFLNYFKCFFFLSDGFQGEILNKSSLCEWLWSEVVGSYQWCPRRGRNLRGRLETWEARAHRNSRSCCWNRKTFSPIGTLAFCFYFIILSKQLISLAY